MLIKLLFENPQFYFLWVLLAGFSICCHEYAHAQMALWQGDSTAADEGHLTLNPMRQMGPVSLVMLCVIGFAWGNVPVNPSRMRRPYSDALVSFSGPAMNLLLFLLFAMAQAIAFRAGAGKHLQLFLFLGGMLNSVLFLLNLMPVPPLDGWSVLRYFVPSLRRLNQELLNGALVGLFFLVLFSSSYFFQFGAKLFELTTGAFSLLLALALGPNGG